MKDAVKKELIGSFVEVLQSRNKSLIGKKGKVIDETKNMIMLEGNQELIKDQVTLEIDFDNQKYVIDGKLLVGRPEDRLKRRNSK